MNIKTYIERVEILTYTPFFIASTGDGYYVEDGVRYTRKEFNKKYPLPVSLVLHKKQNSDGTKNFLHTD